MPFQQILRALTQMIDTTVQTAVQAVQINTQTAKAVQIPILPTEPKYDTEIAFREQLVLVFDR
jgi:hypothetical protein